MVTKFLQSARKSLQQVFEWRPPSQIVSPYPVDQAEYKKAMAETQIERDWYATAHAYQNIDAIHQGIEDGRLIKVGSEANYLPILRFRNPDLMDRYPPYLTSAAKALLDELTAEWRKEINRQKLSKKIRLAISSLTRTVDYQNFLLAEGRFAQASSPHTFGEAFDVDSAGYYVGEQPMNPRVAVAQQFEEGFQKMSSRLKPREFADLSQHNPKVTAVFKKILERKQTEGQLHFIVEFAGGENEIFHICRNPTYHPKPKKPKAKLRAKSLV